MDGQGGGLRHRGEEKRGVAYNVYDPISNVVVHSVEYISEYNRGDSAIGVHSLEQPTAKKIQEVFAYL